MLTFHRARGTYYHTRFVSQSASRYLWDMATITLRTDTSTDEALEALTTGGQTRSEVIRDAILAAYRARRHALLRAEADALRNDADDVAASRDLAAEMDSVRAWTFIGCAPRGMPAVTSNAAPGTP